MQKAPGPGSEHGKAGRARHGVTGAGALLSLAGALSFSCSSFWLSSWRLEGRGAHVIEEVRDGAEDLEALGSRSAPPSLAGLDVEPCESRSLKGHHCGEASGARDRGTQISLDR